MSAPARTLNKDALTGAQKCAILCMALGPDGAAAILQKLSPDQVEEVTREIASAMCRPIRSWRTMIGRIFCAAANSIRWFTG